MKRIKCLLGKHDAVFITTSGNSQQDLYQCRYCGKQAIFHYGILCNTGFSNKRYDKIDTYQWRPLSIYYGKPKYF